MLDGSECPWRENRCRRSKKNPFEDFRGHDELTPPKGIDLTDIYAKADLLKPYVDAVNLIESPRARLAIEPKSVGHLLLDRGLEPIVQIDGAGSQSHCHTG